MDIVIYRDPKKVIFHKKCVNIVLAIFLLGGVFLGGCSDEKTESKFLFDSGQAVLPVVKVDTTIYESLKVGESPKATCVFYDEEGHEVPVEEGDVSVTYFPTELFSVTKQGIQVARTVGSATATCQSAKYGLKDTEPAKFEIQHGDAAKTRVVIERDIVKAGDDVPYRCEVFDAYGNPIEDAETEITISPTFSTTTSTEGHLRIENSGLYNVACSSSGASEMSASNLEVRAGAPVELVLSVQPEEVFYSLNQVVTVKPHVFDEFGNEVKDLDLEVRQGLGDKVAKELYGNQYQLNEEGRYQFYVETELEDGKPLHVEKTLNVNGVGPAIDCVNPQKGQFVEGEFGYGLDVQVSATDIAGVQSVTIDGQEVTEHNGEYHYTLPSPTFGMNYFKVVAVDATGKESSRICSFIFSNQYSRDIQTIIKDTVAISLDQDAIDDYDRTETQTIGDILHRILNSSDAERKIGDEITAAAVKLDNIKSAKNFHFQGTNRVRLKLTSDGLKIDIVIPKMKLWAEGTRGFFSASGDVYIYNTTISVTMGIKVENGQIIADRFRVNNASVGSVDTDFSGITGWIVNSFMNFTSDVSDALDSYVRSDFKHILNTYLFKTIDLSDFTTDFTIPSFTGSGPDVVTRIGMAFTYADVDAYRFRVGLGASIYPKGVSIDGGKGAPFRWRYQASSIPMGSNTRVDIFAGLLNQALFSMWKGKALSGTYKATDPDGFLKEGSELSFHAHLPPVADVQPDREVSISLGAMDLSIMIPGYFDDPIAIEVGIRAKGYLNIDASEQLYLENPEITDFYLVPIAGDLSEEYRQLLQDKVKEVITPMISQFVSSALPTIPIPGFSFESSSFNLPVGRRLTVLSPQLTSVEERVTLEGGFGLK